MMMMMKLLTVLLALIGTMALPTTRENGVDTTTQQQPLEQPPPQGRTLLNEYEDYEPWPNGTPVYYEWEGEWYNGEISKYFDGVYTITWEEENESDEYFDDLDVIDTMVMNAQNNKDDTDIYEIGTPVRDYSENQWWDGIIVDFRDGSYRIEWTNDGSVEEFPPGVEVDEMVEIAAATTEATATEAVTTATPTEIETTIAPTEKETTAEPTEAVTTLAPTTSEDVVDANVDDDPWEIGTEVYKFFPSDGWYWGTISWYNEGVYTVLWDDNTKEKYDDPDEVDEMVAAAEEERLEEEKDTEVDPWDDGTAVYKVFPEDGAYFGEIIAYSDGEYTIRWSDGDVEIHSVPETDDMVEAAYEKVMMDRAKNAQTLPQGSSSRTTGGKFAVAMLIVVGVLGLAYLVQRRRRGRRMGGRMEKGTSSANNIAPVSYKDSPDADAPVDIPDII